MYFEYPYLLWLLVLPVLLLALYLYREWKERDPHLRVSTVTPWEAGGKSVLGIIRHLPEAFFHTKGKAELNELPQFVQTVQKSVPM